VAEEVAVDACGGERSLERPDRTLGVGGGASAADRLEERLRVDGVPVHRLPVFMRPQVPGPADVRKRNVFVGGRSGTDRANR
jgi:hypothetical protein